MPCDDLLILVPSSSQLYVWRWGQTMMTSCSDITSQSSDPQSDSEIRRWRPAAPAITSTSDSEVRRWWPAAPSSISSEGRRRRPAVQAILTASCSLCHQLALLRPPVWLGRQMVMTSGSCHQLAVHQLHVWLGGQTVTTGCSLCHHFAVLQLPVWLCEEVDDFDLFVHLGVASGLHLHFCRSILKLLSVTSPRNHLLLCLEGVTFS